MRLYYQVDASEARKGPFAGIAVAKGRDPISADVVKVEHGAAEAEYLAVLRAFEIAHKSHTGRAITVETDLDTLPELVKGRQNGPVPRVPRLHELARLIAAEMNPGDMVVAVPRERVHSAHVAARQVVKVHSAGRKGDPTWGPSRKQSDGKVAASPSAYERMSQ